jgi:branched-chain amino acid transport system permease protein
MRALSQDEVKAKIVGINPDRLSILTFAIGSALAGIAGALIGGIYGLSAFMGLDVILIAFVIVVVGGMSSILGATLAGLLIGISEAFVTNYFAAEYASVVAVSLLLVFLMYRPQGLLGTAMEREG